MPTPRHAFKIEKNWDADFKAINNPKEFEDIPGFGSHKVYGSVNIDSGKFIPSDYKFPVGDQFAEKIRRKWDSKDKEYAMKYYKQRRNRYGEFG